MEEMAMEETPRQMARRLALAAAGHRPDAAPLHAVEAHPLTALALHLSFLGRAGITGTMDEKDGVMEVNEMEIGTYNGRIRLYSPGTMRVELESHLGEAVVMSLAGRHLHEIVDLPRCGDERIDAAVHGLRIMSAKTLERSGSSIWRVHMVVEKTNVMGIEAIPEGVDAEWMRMEPIPQI